jgi:hypothetical protein
VRADPVLPGSAGLRQAALYFSPEAAGAFG